MSGSPPSYSESLLQWIWQNRQFDLGRLQSSRGETVLVHHPGRPNPSDGPDFRSARVSIGRLTWYGDVEVHWRASDWTGHRHHTNPDYNRVILHVIYRGRKRKPSRRADGSRIPQLYLRRYMTAPLCRFLEASVRRDRLPCGGLLPSLPQGVFAGQIARAHEQYFERKVRDTLRWFPARLSLTAGWRRMTGKALFDGLGIAHNRRSMRELFDLAAGRGPGWAGRVDFPDRLLKLSGINGTEEERRRWNHKGCRPNNHPRVRIRQAACAWRFLRGLDPEEIRSVTPAGLWENLLGGMPGDHPLGEERSSILYATVLLPSLFLLGGFLNDSALKKQARLEWRNHRALIPQELLRPFLEAGADELEFRHLLGAVYQLRHYCRGRGCDRCEVFKQAIKP